MFPCKCIMSPKQSTFAIKWTAHSSLSVRHMHMGIKEIIYMKRLRQTNILNLHSVSSIFLHLHFHLRVVDNDKSSLLQTSHWRIYCPHPLHTDWFRTRQTEEKGEGVGMIEPKAQEQTEVRKIHLIFISWATVVSAWCRITCSAWIRKTMGLYFSQIRARSVELVHTFPRLYD